MPNTDLLSGKLDAGACHTLTEPRLSSETFCRPWDICAGAIIAQEAGGFVAGSHSAPLDNDVNEDVLWGRKHIVVRAIGDTEVRASLA